MASPRPRACARSSRAGIITPTSEGRLGVRRDDFHEAQAWARAGDAEMAAASIIVTVVSGNHGFYCQQSLYF